MKRMNHLVFGVFLMLSIFNSQAQEKDFNFFKSSFMQWEQSQESYKEYYNYLNNSSTILAGKDISFLNSQYSELEQLLQNVDSFEDNHKNTKVAESLFLRIKALEVFLDFAEVCKNNIKVFNVLNESNVVFLRAEGEFYDRARLYLDENYVFQLISDWNYINPKLAPQNVLEAIKSTSFYSEFLKSSYGQHVNLDLFKTKVKERRQTNYRYLVNEFNDGFIDTSSRLVSNFFGFFRIRKGKLYKDEDFLKDAKTGVAPLDILLEKTPFRLTDKIIPGYWSHAAVYVGNEIQLKNIGIWEDPLVVPHHEAIRNGACIIEALRTSVAINSFESFSNVDAYAQLRVKETLSLEEKQKMLLTVFAQIGKEYDFRFNIESSDKMVCTEIHYLAYEMLEFQPTLNLGAYSVSIDDLAVQGTCNSILQPIKLYVEGQKVEKDIQKKYDALISDKIEERASNP